MSLTVIDVGCETYGGDESVNKLIAEYKPDRLIGIDPHLRHSSEWTHDSGTRVDLHRAAAWTARGGVEFSNTGLGGHVEDGGVTVPTIDLIRLVRSIEGDVIVKMDAEMSEYELLPALMGAGLDEKIKLLLIEWHCPSCKHGTWSHSTECEAPNSPHKLRGEIERGWKGEIQEWTQ